MNVTEETAVKLVITRIPDLDPITVFLEDHGEAQGTITITSFGESWNSYWGAMGKGHTIETFFCKCNEDYLANKLSPRIESTVHDVEAIENHAKRHIFKSLRARDIDKNEARELYDEICQGIEEPLDGELLHNVYGDEWWHALPEKPNHKYEYLCKIIRTVQAAIKERKLQRENHERTKKTGS